MGNKTVILGAGIAGMAAGYKLGRQATIYEARDRIGGLCDNFEINGFRFDYAAHLSFTKDKTVREIFDQTAYITHQPKPLNYCNGYWIKHPVQNNSFHLPVQERIKIIKGFIERNHHTRVNNYEDWLRFQYGDYFAEKYPCRYTRKYWCCEAKDLSVNWVNERMYQPSIDEVLLGAMADDTPDTYYTKEMRYPLRGGFKAFFEHLAERLNIETRHRVAMINTDQKKVSFDNGKTVEYERLISSLPLPVIAKLLHDCPPDVSNAAKNLYATSMCLISVGFYKKVNIPALWFYVYDEEMPFARVHSPSLKSIYNVPDGKSSLQFEIYYTQRKPLRYSESELKWRVIDAIIKMKVADRNDIQFIDVRHVEFANIVFYQGMEQDREKVLNYLDSAGIKSIGRFGEWDYLWSDQSFLSGYSV